MACELGAGEPGSGEVSADFEFKPANADRCNVVGLKHLVAVHAAVDPVDEVGSAALVGGGADALNEVGSADCQGATEFGVPRVLGAQGGGTLGSAHTVVEVGKGGQAKAAVGAGKGLEGAAVPELKIAVKSKVRKPIHPVAVVEVGAQVGLDAGLPQGGLG